MQAPIYVNNDTSASYYIYVRTESDTFCRPHIDSAWMVVDSLPNVELVQLDSALCYTDSVALQASGAEYYFWSSTDALINDSLPDSTAFVQTEFNGTTTFTVTGVDSLGCSTTALLEVLTKENVKPVAEAVYDPMQCYPLDVEFDINVSLPIGVSITDVDWIFGDGNSSSSFNPIHVFERSLDSLYPAKYQVIMSLKYSNACVNGDTVYVDVCENFILPNVFTPNGDGQNDVFEIPGYYQLGGPCHFVLHDRWGNLIYESLDYTNDWNGTNIKGKNAAPGLYYYSLRCSDNKAWTGWIRLIR